MSESKNIKYVCFENIKRRGNVANKVHFSYRTEPDISYRDLLASVRRVSEVEINSINYESQISEDENIIQEIIDCINTGINLKMDLARTVSNRVGISRRNTLLIIDRYTGNNPSMHKWRFTVQAHGAKVYQLLNNELGENTNEN